MIDLLIFMVRQHCAPLRAHRLSPKNNRPELTKQWAEIYINSNTTSAAVIRSMAT
jgi:hypothetical protein